MNLPDLTYERRGESRLLRAALLGNSLLKGVLGLACILAAGPVVGLLGLQADNATLYLRIFGMMLFSFGALLLWFAAQHRVSPRFVGTVVALNLAWSVGSVAAVVGPWLVLTDTGRLVVLVQAVVLAVFALLQGYYAYHNQDT